MCFKKIFGSSNIWQGLVSTASIIRTGAQIKVQNGFSIVFWLDTWLLDSPLYEKAITEIPFDDLQKSVANY